MGLIVSILTAEFIIITVDSTKPSSQTDHQKDELAKQPYVIDRVGYVIAWGDVRANGAKRFLDAHKLSPATHSVEDLADLVEQYLVECLRPHERGYGDLGYHVVGFHHEKGPCIYLVSWESDEDLQAEHSFRRYRRTSKSPDPGDAVIVYNARSDLVKLAVNTLANQARLGSEMRYNLATPVGLTQFSDFLARFAGELSPEVNPPFITRIITARPATLKIANPSFSPLDSRAISRELLRHMPGLLADGKTHSADPSSIRP